MKIQGPNNFVLTCFHVGYNGENNRVLPGLPTIEDFNRVFGIFRLEARRPCQRQMDTEHHYQPRNEDDHLYGVVTSYMGKYVYGLFDQDKDLLLIHIGKDVKFKCAIEKYFGECGMTD